MKLRKVPVNGGDKMNKKWLLVFIAGVFEICWVIGLKHPVYLWEWTGTVISIIVSFVLLIYASAKLPVGTVYAVFAGMGTAGTVLAEMILFGEPFKLLKMALILLLLCGVIGLKLVTDQKEDQEAAQKGADQ